MLNEKTVLLTGGTTYIGLGIANALSELGANVALLDKNGEKAERLAEQINDQSQIKKGRGRAAAIPADLAKPHHAREAVSKAAESFGGIDIYVDALTLARNLTFEDPKFFEELDRFVDVNMRAPLFLTHEVLRFMKGRRRGRIVYLVQDLSRIGYTGETLSSISRTGLMSFARSLAREVAPFQITVNCVAVGPTEEYLMARDPGAPSIQQVQQDLLKHIPLAKMTLPNDVSGLVAFLAGPDSGAITGQTLAVSGGLS